jgi:hypothetical protein
MGIAAEFLMKRVPVHEMNRALVAQYMLVIYV